MDEEQYDGFYGVSTDFTTELADVISVNKNRWEIEESFKILKTDLKTRPMYLINDERIKAHLLICFIALYLYRIMEKNLLRNKYSCDEIINTLRDMTIDHIGNNVIPNFTITQCARDIQTYTHTIIDYECLTDQQVKKIISKNLSTPDKVKRLFDTNRKRVGRPSKGDIENNKLVDKN